MATQRPPWFRLPTMRPPAPAPAPAPAPPRPATTVRPAIPFRPPPPPAQPQESQPSPPAPPKPRSPPAAPPSSPVTKAALTNIQQPPSHQIKTQTPSSSVQTTNVNPLSSPKTVKPPSPLQLPPAQIEEERHPKIEQKSVLVQEKPTKTNNPHNLPSKGKRNSPTKDMKKLSDSEDFGMRVITIAGDNRGALMEINSSNNKPHPHTLANSKNEQGKSDDNNNSPQPMATFLNSNVQGVNNSIVFNSTCHHNDPGIHLSLIRK